MGGETPPIRSQMRSRDRTVAARIPARQTVRVRTRPVVALLAAAIALTGCTATPPTPTAPPTSAAAQASTETFTPIVGRVLAAPAVAPSTDGRVHLAYELLLSNVLSQDVMIDEVVVTGASRALLTLAGDDLAPWMKVYGGASGSRTIGPGQQALVWLDVVVPALRDVPPTLAHTIRIRPTTPIPPVVGSPMTETLAATPVHTGLPIVISPPLAGRGWLDGNSCCAVTPHRAAVNPINGALHVPERYAIDYVRLDDQGRVFHGPVDRLSSYAYEGADILAVADGPVVSMTWDLPEQTPGANPTGLTLAQYGGNHIVQDLGGGHYAFYAHLQPGNPEKVRVGQVLRRGQVIAHLGNSGNSDSPHLHFHIMDAPLPLAANGLPFRIDAFDLAGTVAPSAIDACAGSGIPCVIDSRAAGPKRSLSPLYGDVMDYPAR